MFNVFETACANNNANISRFTTLKLDTTTTKTVVKKPQSNKYHSTNSSTIVALKFTSKYFKKIIFKRWKCV